MRVHRTDVVSLDQATKTPEGYLDFSKAKITKTGVFEYSREDGKKQLELRLPEHVFDEKALATFDGVPLAMKHPSQNFDAGTFKRDAVGVVMYPRKGEDGVHVEARIRVMDAEAVRAVEGGLRELSNGYDVDLIPVPNGVFRRDDWNGGQEVRVDYIQANIRGNHTALVERGRAGPTARLDSAGNQQGEEMDPKELEKKIAEAIEAALVAQRAKLDEVQGARSQLEAEIKRRDEADQKSRVRAVAERAAPIAKRAADELEKLGEDEAMRAALAKASPDLKTDGWSTDRLRGAFDAALVQDSKRTDAATQAADAAAKSRKASEEEPDRRDAEDPYQKMVKNMTSAWKGQKKE